MKKSVILARVPFAKGELVALSEVELKEKIDYASHEFAPAKLVYFAEVHMVTTESLGELTQLASFVYVSLYDIAQTATEAFCQVLGKVFVGKRTSTVIEDDFFELKLRLEREGQSLSFDEADLPRLDGDCLKWLLLDRRDFPVVIIKRVSLNLKNLAVEIKEVATWHQPVIEVVDENGNFIEYS